MIEREQDIKEDKYDDSVVRMRKVLDFNPMLSKYRVMWMMRR